MKQSPTISLVEAATNVVVGYLLAIATQIVVFPSFGTETQLTEHLTIGLVQANGGFGSMGAVQ